MANRDWSLVFFTTLAQCSIGMVLWFTLAGFINHGPESVFQAGLSFRNPVLLALVLILSATLSSFLHLGNPVNAPRALNNLKGSWLSREILAIGVFSLSLLSALIAGWRFENPAYLHYLMVLSSACGLVLLWMMIRVYMLPTIPPWNSWHTPVSFVLTSVNLGLLTMLAFHVAGMANIDGDVFNRLVVLLLLILFAITASGIFHQYQLQKLNTGIYAPVYDQGLYYRIFLFRTALLIIAFLAVFAVILNTGPVPGNSGYAWLYPISVLIVIEELSGRLLFYSAYFRTGV